MKRRIIERLKNNFSRIICSSIGIGIGGSVITKVQNMKYGIDMEFIGLVQIGFTVTVFALGINLIYEVINAIFQNRFTNN